MAVVSRDVATDGTVFRVVRRSYVFLVERRDQNEKSFHSLGLFSHLADAYLVLGAEVALHSGATVIDPFPHVWVLPALRVGDFVVCYNASPGTWLGCPLTVNTANGMAWAEAVNVRYAGKHGTAILARVKEVQS